MPDAQAILQRLAYTASEFVTVAMVWHLTIAVAVVLLLARLWRPSERAAATLLAFPALSVAALAWQPSTAFNAIMFLALAGLLMSVAARLERVPAQGGPRWAQWSGGAALGFAWAYPHFFGSFAPSWFYVSAAPIGVLPCPTLAAIAGFGLLAGGFGSRAWLLCVALPSLAYALFGVLYLRVWLDLGLLLAAVALLACDAGLRSARVAAAEQTLREERRRIDDFLACRRIALVGASSEPSHFSRLVMRELLDHGIDVVPVHPSASVIEGRSAARRLTDIDPSPQGVLVMTPAAASVGVVEESARAGIRRIWLHRGVGAGAVSDAAVRAAQALRLELVAGRCPLMFLGDHPAAIHRLHAAALRLSHHYPLADQPTPEAPPHHSAGAQP